MLKNSGLLPYIIVALGIVTASMIYKGSSVTTWIGIAGFGITLSLLALHNEKRACFAKVKASERQR